MPRSLFRLTVVGIVLAAQAAATHAGPPAVRWVEAPATSGPPNRAVVVERAALVHTAQLLPLTGDVVHGGGDAAGQAAWLLETLEQLVQHPGERLVALNVYGRTADDLRAARQQIERAFEVAERPVIRVVETPLAHPAARVAIDAVLAVATDAPPRSGLTGAWAARDGFRRHATLPAGPRAYISGQAERGDGTLAGATRATLDSLERTLAFLGAEWSDVVALKCFLTPMSQVGDVRGALRERFASAAVPPCALVEWDSTLPIEIELVVACPARDGSPAPIEFLTPPGMTPSPVYSRVARVHGPATIYTDSLWGDPARGVDGELRSLFGDLGRLAQACGSDLGHLAKATYYVATEQASQRLGAIRPEFYDPARPPAASKASVAGTGREGTRLNLELIAVPAAGP